MSPAAALAPDPFTVGGRPFAGWRTGLRPFADATGLETTAESGGVTEVTWSMRGSQSVGQRIFGVFFSMDKLVGKDFEKGLAALKGLAEAGTPTPTA